MHIILELNEMPDRCAFCVAESNGMCQALPGRPFVPHGRRLKQCPIKVANRIIKCKEVEG